MGDAQAGGENDEEEEVDSYRIAVEADDGERGGGKELDR